MKISNLTAIFMGLVFAINTLATQQSNLLNIATYNIRQSGGNADTPNSWQNRCNDFVNFIREMKLDVIGFQEVTPIQLEFLGESLSEYSYLGEFREKDRKSGEAGPVFYRKSLFELKDSGTFWLSETPDVPGSKSWRTACPRICTWVILKDTRTGKSFAFANVHTDHKSPLARTNGLRLILQKMEHFAKGVPVILLGDLNCSEIEQGIVEVSKVLRNAMFVSETPPTGPWRSYTGWKWRKDEVSTKEALTVPIRVRSTRRESSDEYYFRKEGLEPMPYSNYINGARLDYIFVSPAIRVLSYATRNDSRPNLNLYPSDHFPVTVTIVLP